LVFYSFPHFRRQEEEQRNGKPAVVTLCVLTKLDGGFGASNFPWRSAESAESAFCLSILAK
jgi:hypothetical protein